MVTTPFSYRNNYSRKVYVVVLGRNRTLFHCVIRLHYHIWSSSTKLPLRAGLIHAAKKHEYLISLHSYRNGRLKDCPPLNIQYIVYCLWRKIDVTLDGHQPLSWNYSRKQSFLEKGGYCMLIHIWLPRPSAISWDHQSQSPYLHTQITSKSLFPGRKGGPRSVWYKTIHYTDHSLAIADTKLGSSTCISCTNAVTSIGGKYHRYVTRLNKSDVTSYWTDVLWHFIMHRVVWGDSLKNAQILHL